MGFEARLLECHSLIDCRPGVAYPLGAVLVIVGSCTVPLLLVGSVPGVMLSDEIFPRDTGMRLGRSLPVLRVRATRVAVLYQWEMLNLPLEASSWVTGAFVAVHQKYHVWEHEM